MQKALVNGLIVVAVLLFIGWQLWWAITDPDGYTRAFIGARP